MQSNVRQSEDLTNIKGIGEVRAQWLQEVDINAMPDLISIPAQEVESRLQAGGHTLSLKEIEDWQKQAQELVIGENVTLSQAKTIATARPTEGKTFATFVVEFQKLSSDQGDQLQTLVHHMEGGEAGGGKSKKWEGLAKNELCNWMNQQIDEKYLTLDEAMTRRERLPEAERKRPLATPASPRPAVTLSIQDAELIQRPANVPVPLDGTGRMFIYPVRHQTPFDLHVVFELTGQTRSSGNAPSFFAQAYAINKTTGKTNLLGESEPQPSVPEQSRQTIKLSGIRLPQGLYRLQLMVRGADMPGSLGFLEVPYLQVE